jgi:predicted TIM-barrel fold metal-dependent hydrolase
LRVSYPALLRTFARAMADLDDAARQAIWHDNAMRVYRIA